MNIQCSNLKLLNIFYNLYFYQVNLFKYKLISKQLQYNINYDVHTETWGETAPI